MQALLDDELLKFAIIGLETEEARIKDRLASARAQLAAHLNATELPDGWAGDNVKEMMHPKKKRVLSPEARKAIAAAQQKRWRKYRKAKANGAETNKQQTKSAAAMNRSERMSIAQKARWAKKHAEDALMAGSPKTRRTNSHAHA
jgi:hypothetical protein